MYYVIVEPRSFRQLHVAETETAADKWVKENFQQEGLRCGYSSLCCIFTNEIREYYTELGAAKRYTWKNRKLQIKTYNREPDKEYQDD